MHYGWHTWTRMQLVLCQPRLQLWRIPPRHVNRIYLNNYLHSFVVIWGWFGYIRQHRGLMPFFRLHSEGLLFPPCGYCISCIIATTSVAFPWSMCQKVHVIIIQSANFVHYHSVAVGDTSYTHVRSSYIICICVCGTMLHQYYQIIR